LRAWKFPEISFQFPFPEISFQFPPGRTPRSRKFYVVFPTVTLVLTLTTNRHPHPHPQVPSQPRVVSSSQPQHFPFTGACGTSGLTSDNSEKQLASPPSSQTISRVTMLVPTLVLMLVQRVCSDSSVRHWRYRCTRARIIKRAVEMTIELNVTNLSREGAR